MSKQFNVNKGQEKDQQIRSGQTENADQEKKDISLPKIDRPQGPFEHSGETSRWTKEEKEEKEQDKNEND